MGNFKTANELSRSGHYTDALKIYKQIARTRPELSAIANFNIEYLRKKIDEENLQSNEIENQSTDERSHHKDRSQHYYSSKDSGWGGWKLEFGPGDFKTDKSTQVVDLASSGKRLYLSHSFTFKKRKKYALSLHVREQSGELGNVVALVNFKGIEGQTDVFFKQVGPSGQIKIHFIVTENTSASIRIGIGTTANVSGSAKMIFGDLIIVESDLPKNNRDIISEFAKEYIDPELILPELGGLGNNYSSIQEEAELLIGSRSKWENIKVSIIIPAYERGDFLRKTLACLVHQTYPMNLTEVIIVDDGSDKTNYEMIFNEYALRLNLFLTRQKRDGCGLARARNLGARSAAGTVLVFLDSDILLPRDFVRELMAFHHVEENCSVLGVRKFVDSSKAAVEELLSGRIQPENIPQCVSSNPHFTKFLDKNGNTYDWRLDDFRKNNWLTGSTNPFRYFGGGHASVGKERFFATGGYDESFTQWGNEDQEFAYRLWGRGQYFIPLRGIFDYHQEEKQTKGMQQYKLEENKFTDEIFRNKCPHFTVRAINMNNSGFEVPLFSIYVPAYNVEDYIEHCVESVLQQTYQDYELIVVDDGSTDSTWDKLQKYSNIRNMKLFRKENGGIGSASNYGIRKATGEYIVQLDSDDALFPEALEKLALFFQKNTDAECVYTKHSLVDAAGAQLGQGWSPTEFDRYDNLVGMSVPHLRSFRRALYHRTVGFDERLVNAVDYDFFLKLSNIAQIKFLDETLYRYRVHSTQTSSAKKGEQIKNHEIVVTKYLAQMGFDDFYAKSLNPFEPRRNFVLKRGAEFEWMVSSRHFKQPQIQDFALPLPKCPGNNYTSISEFVKDFYLHNLCQYTEKISVVVPVYNRAERLSRCLAGICQQTYPRELMEVVVVDDGSSDEVLTVVKKYAKLLNLKYVKQRDDGYRLSAARNLGIRAASHKNISIVDCDLIPLPKFIESFMQYLHHFDNVVLLGHQRFVDPTGISDDDILQDVRNFEKFKDIKSENSTMENALDGITRDWRYKLYEETDYLKNDEHPYRAFSSGHVAYKKRTIEDAGYYDEEFNIWGCEDNEAGYRIYQKGYYFIPVLEAVDLHQEPPSGKNETNREEHRVISRELLQSKLPAMRGWFGAPYQIKDADVPLVSVCIPVHNTGDFAKLAVDSVLSQSMQDLEVVIYDDASNDGTLELLQHEFASNHKVRILEGKSHRNVTYARNMLITHARGEFVGFLDSDDILKPSCIEECLKLFRGKPNVGLICTGYEQIDEAGAFLRDGWNPSEFNRKGLLFGNIFTHFRIFRLRDWNRSRKWNERELESFKYGEDWDLCLKLAEVTEFDRVDKVLYQYRVRGASITNASNFIFKADQTLMIIETCLRNIGMTNVKPFSITGNNPHEIGFMYQS